MKHLFLSLSFLLCCMASAAADRLTLAEAPVAGRNITANYVAAGGPLEGKRNVVAVVYTYNDYRWQVMDFVMQPLGDGRWTGSFMVPQNSGVLLVKLLDSFAVFGDVASDTNDGKGYIFKVVDAKGKPMPGSFIGAATATSSTIQSAMPGFRACQYAEQTVEASADEMLAALAAEKKAFKKNVNKFLQEERGVLLVAYGKDAAPHLKALADRISKIKNPMEQQLFAQYCIEDFDLHDTAAGEALGKTMEERFPSGMIARRKHLEFPYSLKGAEMVQAEETLRSRFPIADYYARPDYYGFRYDSFYRHVSQSLFDEGMYDRLAVVMKEMNSAMIVDAMLHQTKQSLKFPDRDPKSYYDISVKYFRELLSKVGDPCNMTDTRWSPSQLRWKNTQDVNFYATVMTVLASRAEHYQDGIDFMNVIPEAQRFAITAEGNEAYSTCLEKLGRNDEVQAVLKASAADGKMTSQMHSKFETLYDAMPDKPAANFEDYLYSLKSPEQKARMKKEVKAGLVDDPYKAFVVKDFNGGQVSSADFANDDIVVIDFWATWCAPCCAALEGMNMAVQKYKGDAKVKFYFMDTQDQATAAELQAYWKRRGFSKEDMVVTFDNGAGSRPADVYCDMFPHASGIPQKAVLKNGRVRYRASGYMGSPSGLKDEISTVIELLKAEK